MPSRTVQMSVVGFVGSVPQIVVPKRCGVRVTAFDSGSDD